MSSVAPPSTDGFHSADLAVVKGLHRRATHVEADVDTPCTNVCIPAVDVEPAHNVSPRPFVFVFVQPFVRLVFLSSAWASIIDPEDLVRAISCYDVHIATRGAVPFNLNVSYKHKKGHDVSISS